MKFVLSLTTASDECGVYEYHVGIVFNICAVTIISIASRERLSEPAAFKGNYGHDDMLFKNLLNIRHDDVHFEGNRTSQTSYKLMDRCITTSILQPILQYIQRILVIHIIARTTSKPS
eukprot:scaffold3172_cov275-Chaetoceros_neogracile.AAC.6